ncbi:Hypothetical protein R9X50_00313600 [Acrodontium crateriforme]|uniref:RNA helicase n=1 Tax=Acrodontium crateriforme TaxID=150365 RepID=A0AAQ3M5M4_9PEZI|nr:Hypothetical protein R9X50_00313600 [Acrodontium crateriforme]
MAGGNKKKKKPAANPARGFATTSIQSAKSKLEDLKDVNLSTDASRAVTPDTIPTSSGTPAEQQKSSNGIPRSERELHELSPEELEAQLEESELQQLVEQLGSKVRKESFRQVSRLQTDKRVLRGQADFLSVKDWLPDDLMQEVLSLIKLGCQTDQNSSKPPVSPVGDDLLSKVWTLRLTLLNLDIPSNRADEAIGWVISNPQAQDNSGLIWGLSDAFEWLALNCDTSELLDYDFQKPKATNEENETITTEPSVPQESEPEKNRQAKQDKTIPTEDNTSVLEEADIDISDIESDLEPDELLSVYMRTKARLYEINPAADDAQLKKKRGSSKSPSNFTGNRSLGEKKLQQRLDKIQSDVLFDKQEADAQWAVQRVNLARDAAERRKYQLSQDPLSNGQSTRPEKSGKASQSNVADEAEQLGLQLLKESEELDEDGMLVGMFDTLPGVLESTTTDGVSASVTIRDFGRLTGMNPKRILEEACKSRNQQVKIVYKMISPTTYASRHSVTISWSKDQDIIDGAFLPAIEVQSKLRTCMIQMKTIATPDVAQSEAYVATVALYLIFSGSPKEEKAHMKLPPAYRDLWAELAETRKGTIEAGDRETIKHLRSLIKEHTQPEDDEPEEVVFNANSRRRCVDGVSGTATPTSQRDLNKILKPPASEELAHMWAQKSSTPSYQRMLASRMNLPMFQFRATALEAIARHQVTILCGETGCGKSTQLPAFILEHELSQGRQCKIYCTEPRRISAISLAQRVSEEMGENKGDVGTRRSLVGYAIRLESHTTSETRLVYATVGIVLRMLEGADGIKDITHLVIDEVHERSIDTDFLLIILRSLMLRRPDLKVILMSATVDAQKFSNYLDGAPIISVPGRTFPVEAKFLEDAIELTGHTNEDASENVADDENEFAESDGSEKAASKSILDQYSKATRNTLASYDEYRIDYSLIMKLLQRVAYDGSLQKFSKAILVFLPGIAEIRRLNDMLTAAPAFSKGWRIHPLHSSFSSEDQQAAFDVPPSGTRKIVLATNIAETGITIPDVTCVIDTGKHKEMRFDERRQLSKLILSFIARANAKQRRGRAGRVQEGICFHLFTRQRHDEILAEQQTPEMLRLSLQDLVMRVKICKLGDIEHALTQALDPPSTRNIRRAIDALVEVDALTTGEELTPLGLQIAKLPLDAQLGKLVLLASIFGCLDFALTAAAALSSKSPFLNPIHAKKQADTVRLGYKRGDSDILTLYNAYCTWRKVCTTPGMSEHQFCNKNFLSQQSLANIEDLKGQLLSSLVETGFVQLGPAEKSALSKIRPGARQRNFVMLPAVYCRADEDDMIISSVVAWSFYPKIVKQEGKGWRNIANNQSLGLHPTSVNKIGLATDIKLLSFYSIMQSSSRFTNAQETTPAPEMALVLLAGDAVLNMYAGVVVIDGNRLRYKFRDWKTMMVMKALRSKLKEALARLFKSPGRELVGKNRLWMEILEKMFEHRQKAHMIERRMG